MSFVAPTALCRLDGRLLERIHAGRDLRGVVLSEIATIVIGAGSYGVAFGSWRAPEQAIYSAIKLPALLLSVALCTVGLGAMLGILLRSKLSVQQTGVCTLQSLAVTSVVLGALAPMSLAVALLVPPPSAAGSLAVGRAVLLLHTAVVAGAGTAGVVRLRTLLARLGLAPSVARRVLVSWIGAQFLVGSQLSWLLRPFLGAPGVRPALFSDDPLHGSFFAAVLVAMRSTFGPAAPFVLALSAGATVVTLVKLLRTERTWVSVEVGGAGLAVRGATARTVPWVEIGSVRFEGNAVAIHLVADESLSAETLSVACNGPEDAVELARRIDAGRRRVAVGPYRTA